MNGWCVCCDEFGRVDPEDGHCWGCSSGRCGGEHGNDADDRDDVWDEARGEFFDERWLDERGL